MKNRILTDGFARVQSDPGHRRNTEIIWKSTDGFQLVKDDSLLFAHCEKSREIACQNTHKHLHNTKPAADEEPQSCEKEADTRRCQIKDLRAND